MTRSRRLGRGVDARILAAVHGGSLPSLVSSAALAFVEALSRVAVVLPRFASKEGTATRHEGLSTVLYGRASTSVAVRGVKKRRRTNPHVRKRADIDQA
jgi:hypothetical protein